MIPSADQRLKFNTNIELSIKTYLGVVYKGVSKEPAQFHCLLEQPEVSALLSKRSSDKS